MSTVPVHLYGEFRRHARLPAALHENPPHGAPPEHVLQAIWQHQRLRRGVLHTVDGARLTVLHPGFLNRESGPDFRNALIQFGSATPVSGDVEVDLQPSGWRSHGHDRNPAFAKVILHVVWRATGIESLPSLPLEHALDSPLDQLQEWLGTDAAGQLPVTLAGQCCSPLRELSASALGELLRQAALTRLQGKAALISARARESGWDQALWEGLFRALGYKHNTWPMQRLGELAASFHQRGKPGRSPSQWQAILFGMAGLLPTDIEGTGEAFANPRHAEVRRLWDVWWREQDELAELILPRQAWRFSGIRPANHPQRRIALASHWLATGDLPARIAAWFTADAEQKVRAADLLKVFQPPADAFWSNHWTFDSAPMTRPQPLLGETRATDLAVNMVLPWLWARASVGGQGVMRHRVEKMFITWPAGQDNTVLKLARQRLLGNRPLPKPHSAAQQQGLLQIVRDFCDHSNAVCDQCPFPTLVKQLGGGADSSAT